MVLKNSVVTWVIVNLEEGALAEAEPRIDAADRIEQWLPTSTVFGDF